MLAALLLTACPGEVGKDPAEILYVSDVNNYRYSGAIGLGSQAVRLGTDVRFDWSGLTTDIQGHGMEPSEVTTLWLIWFEYLESDELADLLVCNDVAQSDANAIASVDVTGTSAMMSELTVVENPFSPEKYFVYETGTWFTRVTTGSANTRMMGVLAPSAAETNTDFGFHGDLSTLTVDANLSDLTAVTVNGNAEGWTVDWSTLLDGANADGCDPTDVSDADQFWLARYDGKAVADLEAAFLDLELEADAIYTGAGGGITAMDLSTLTNPDDGSAFSGFQSGELWLAALRCTFCENPAPIFLTVLNVE